jgi:hypothetical protein
MESVYDNRKSVKYGNFKLDVLGYYANTLHFSLLLCMELTQ